MKVMAIAWVAVVTMLVDVGILGVGVWLTFILGHSFWWWLLVLMLSFGETAAGYKFVNAINGARLSITE